MTEPSRRSDRDPEEADLTAVVTLSQLGRLEANPDWMVASLPLSQPPAIMSPLPALPSLSQPDPKPAPPLPRPASSALGAIRRLAIEFLDDPSAQKAADIARVAKEFLDMPPPPPPPPPPSSQPATRQSKRKRVDEAAAEEEDRKKKDSDELWESVEESPEEESDDGADGWVRARERMLRQARERGKKEKNGEPATAATGADNAPKGGNASDIAAIKEEILAYVTKYARKAINRFEKRLRGKYVPSVSTRPRRSNSVAVTDSEKAPRKPRLWWVQDDLTGVAPPKSFQSATEVANYLGLHNVQQVYTAARNKGKMNKYGFIIHRGTKFIGKE